MRSVRGVPAEAGAEDTRPVRREQVRQIQKPLHVPALHRLPQIHRGETAGVPQRHPPAIFQSLRREERRRGPDAEQAGVPREDTRAGALRRPVRSAARDGDDRRQL